MANEATKKTRFDTTRINAKTPLRLNVENKTKLFELIDNRNRSQTVQERVKEILSAEKWLKLAQQDLAATHVTASRIIDDNRSTISTLTHKLACTSSKVKKLEERLKRNRRKSKLIISFDYVMFALLIYMLFINN